MTTLDVDALRNTHYNTAAEVDRLVDALGRIALARRPTAAAAG